MLDVNAKANAKKKAERAERRFFRVAKSTNESVKDDEIYPQNFLDTLIKDLKDAHQGAEDETEAYRELLDSDDDTEKNLVKEVDSKLELMQTELSCAASQIARLSTKTKSTIVNNQKTDSNLIKF